MANIIITPVKEYQWYQAAPISGTHIANQNSPSPKLMAQHHEQSRQSISPQAYERGANSFIRIDKPKVAAIQSRFRDVQLKSIDVGTNNHHGGPLLPSIIQNSFTRNNTIEGAEGKSHSFIGMPIGQ